MFEPIAQTVSIWNSAHLVHRELRYGPEFMRSQKEKLYLVTDNFGIVDGSIVSLCDGVFLNEIPLDDEGVKNGAFYIYFSRAERALPALKRIAACGGIFAPPPFFGKQKFFEMSANALESFNEAGLRLGHEPFGGVDVCTQLCQAIEQTSRLEGDFVEVGVYSGSSALVSLVHMRNRGIKRKAWLLDTFAGFAYEEAAKSPDIIWTGTHLMNKDVQMQRVTQLVQDVSDDAVVLENNIMTDDLPAEIERIAIANIDVDMYDAIHAALRKVGERMVHRGIMVVEDPVAVPGLYGGYLALHEFLETELGQKFVCIQGQTQFFLVRTD